MHDLLLHLAWHLSSAPTTPTPPSPPDNTVKVAIVTVIGLIVATSITAIASTFRRESNRPAPPDGVTRQFIAGLEHDRRELGTLRTKYAFLREACFQRGLDPDELIHEQEEP